LDRLQSLYKTGAVAHTEVDEVEASLAKAQAEVAAARQKAANAVAGEPLDAWNRQLLELGVASRERDSRLNYINKRLAKFAGAMELLDQMEEQRAMLAADRKEVIDSEEALRHARKNAADGK
jgi:hypothetical protein